MTRRQLIGVGVLSVLATFLVLLSAGGKSGLSAAATAALARQQAAAAETGAIAVKDARVSSDDVATSPDSSSTSKPATAKQSSGAVDSPTVDDSGSSSDDSSGGGSAGGSGGSGSDAKAADDTPAKTNVKHVFVVTLAGQGYDAAFGTGSAATYLNGTLRPLGTLLTNFSSLGSSAIADRIAFAGGQPPNASTKAGCTTYKEIPASTNPDKEGVVDADGCVYPNTVVSIGDQLTSNRLSWHAYAEDYGNGPGGATVTCRRPVSEAADDTLAERPGDGYTSRTDPFLYFHSLLDLGGCDEGVGALTQLDTDLSAEKTTPNLVYVAPNLCHDGDAVPCLDGSPGGLASADAFLQTWVPKILASAAYKDSGVLFITFAGAPAGAADAPSKNGSLVVSRFAKAGGADDTAYDPFALLRTTEDLLAVKPLAKAATAPSLLDSTLSSAKIAVAGDD